MPNGSIHESSRVDDVNSLTAHLRNPSVDINAVDSNGETALHIAARCGNARSVLILIRHGADVTIPDESHGQTALHKCFTREHLQASLVLIKAGALSSVYVPPVGEMKVKSVDQAKDRYGNTPLRLLFLTTSKFGSTRSRNELNEVYVTGRSDLSLGVPLPRSKYNIEVPKCIDILSSRQIAVVAPMPFASGCVTQSGDVFTWGHGRYGRLGHGNTASYPSPYCVLGLSSYKVSMLAGGDNHMLALCQNSGDVFSWGCNAHGQLGHKDVSSYLSPRRISFFSDLHLKKGKCACSVRKIAAGSNHSLCALNVEQGDQNFVELYAFGDNSDGQLGIGKSSIHKVSRSDKLGPYKKVMVPTKVKYVGGTCGEEGIYSSEICQLSAYSHSSLVSIIVRRSTVGVRNLSFSRIFSTFNEVYQWGNNVFDPFKISMPVNKQERWDDFDDNELNSKGFNMETDGRVISQCMCAKFSAIVLLNGCVYMWGIPYVGPLNMKPALNKPVASVIELQPDCLGMGRKVISSSFGRNCLISALNTGEVVFVPINSDQDNRMNALVSVPVISDSYAGAVKIDAIDDRLFITCAISVPRLPHKMVQKKNDTSTTIKMVDESSECDDVDDETACADPGLLTDTPLSLQEICDNILAANTSLKINFTAYLKLGTITDSFSLLQDIEEDVESLCTAADYKRSQVVDKGQQSCEIIPKTIEIKSSIFNLDRKSKLEPNCDSNLLSAEKFVSVSVKKIEGEKLCKNSIKEKSQCGFSYENVLKKSSNPPDSSNASIGQDGFIPSLSPGGSEMLTTTYKFRSVSTNTKTGVSRHNSPVSGNANLRDHFDAALFRKRGNSKEFSRRKWCIDDAKVADKKVQLADIQNEELLACGHKRSVSRNHKLGKQNVNSRWFVDSRPRAKSLSAIIAEEEEKEKARLLQQAEMEAEQAAITAVEKYIASASDTTTYGTTKAKKKNRPRKSFPITKR